MFFQFLKDLSLAVVQKTSGVLDEIAHQTGRQLDQHRLSGETLHPAHPMASGDAVGCLSSVSPKKLGVQDPWSPGGKGRGAERERREPSEICPCSGSD